MNFSRCLLENLRDGTTYKFILNSGDTKEKLVAKFLSIKIQNGMIGMELKKPAKRPRVSGAKDCQLPFFIPWREVERYEESTK